MKNTPFSTVVEITDTHIKVLRMNIRGVRPAVTFIAQESLKEFSDGEILQILDRLLKASSAKPRETVCLVPRKQVFVRMFDLPSVNIREIERMVALQLPGQIPFAPEEVICRTRIMAADAKGYSQTAVYIMHRDIVGRYLSLFHKLGFFPGALTVSSMAVGRWWNFQKKDFGFSGKDIICLLHVDRFHAEVNIFQDNALLFCRQIPCGFQDCHPGAAEHVVQHIAASLKAFENQFPGRPVRGILLCSSGVLDPRFQEILTSELEISVEHKNHLQNVYCRKDTALPQLAFRQGISFLNAAGILLPGKEPVLNFIPREDVDSKKQTIRKRQWFLLTVLVVAVTILTGVFLRLDIYYKTRQIRSLSALSESLKPRVKSARESAALLQALELQTREKIYAAVFLKKISGLTPEGIFYQSVSLNGKGAMMLEGYARQRKDIGVLQKALVRTKGFSKIHLDSAVEKRYRGMELIRFIIKGQFQSPES